jgi:hypothetical protein
MELFPGLQLGFFSGWFLVAIFYLVFAMLLVLYLRSLS